METTCPINGRFHLYEAGVCSCGARHVYVAPKAPTRQQIMANARADLDDALSRYEGVFGCMDEVRKILDTDSSID